MKNKIAKIRIKRVFMPRAWGGNFSCARLVIENGRAVLAFFTAMAVVDHADGRSAHWIRWDRYS